MPVAIVFTSLKIKGCQRVNTQQYMSKELTVHFNIEFQFLNLNKLQ